MAYRLCFEVDFHAKQKKRKLGPLFNTAIKQAMDTFQTQFEVQLSQEIERGNIDAFKPEVDYDSGLLKFSLYSEDRSALAKIKMNFDLENSGEAKLHKNSGKAKRSMRVLGLSLKVGEVEEI